MLSIVGPSPYQSASNVEKPSKEVDVTKEENEKEEVKPFESYTNCGMTQHEKGVAPSNEVFVINDIRGKEPREETDGNMNELPKNLEILEMRL